MGGFVPYLTGMLRLMERLPIHLYRMGLGSLVNAACILVLTTRGRKSGQPQFAAVEYRRHGSKIYLISGWGDRPDWVQNLLAYPQATGQAGWQILSLRASVVENPAEAVRVLYMFRRPAPMIWDALLARMSNADTVNLNILSDICNQFTIVRLDILPTPPELPVVSTRLAWVWPIALLTLVVVTVIRLLRVHHS